MEKSEKDKYFKKLLQDSLSEVEGYLKSSEDAAAAVSPDKGLGRLSRMEAMQDQQLVMEMRRRKKKATCGNQISISRLEMDNFGVCIFCGAENKCERLMSHQRRRLASVVPELKFSLKRSKSF